MKDERWFWVWPLLLSTLSGLSTTIGGVLAISTTPSEAVLAFLLGTAIGVMATVSVMELWWHKAVEQSNWLGISMAVAAGAMLFAVLDPLVPKPPEPQQLLYTAANGSEAEEQQGAAHAVVCLDCAPQVTVATGVNPGLFAAAPTSSSGNSGSKAMSPLLPVLSGERLISRQSTGQLSGSGRLVVSSHHPQQDKTPGLDSANPAERAAALMELRSHHSGLMRLGVIMAITMTLHNLPEGFAVAFSAFSDIGVQMALAIAMHNIPEGLVISAPIYAATNSKRRAVAIAAASGLSEPLGALIALFVFRPFVSSVKALDYVLAMVGGIMLAVCGLELWPEGRKCQQHIRLYQGILLGSLVMAWTLHVGV